MYTAFFKKNIKEKLQDTDAILSILKSLGYEKTLDEDQVQVKESVDADRVLWVSVDLFLVQLDLQIIKEIMDNLTDDKFSLRDVIRARAKTCNVKEACQYLFAAAAKRVKIEKAQDSETSSKRQPMPTKIQVTAYAVSSADSQSKNFDLSAATDNTAMDTDETTLAVTEGITSVSSRPSPSSMHPAPFSDVTDRDLYGAHAEENQLGTKQGRFVAPDNPSDRTRHLSKCDTKRMVDTSELTSQSLPYLGTTTSPLLSTRISTDTHIAYTDTSTRTGRQVQGSKYVGLRDIRGSASHQVAPNASFQSYRPKETASQHKNSTAVEDRGQLSATEPMEVETQESRANRVENFDSYSNKMDEGVYARPEAQHGVSECSHRSSRLNEFTGEAYALSKAHPGFSDLDRNLRHRLTLESGTSKRAAVQSSSAKEATSKAPSGVSGSSLSHYLSSRSNEFTGGAYAGAEGQLYFSEYGRRSYQSNESTGGTFALSKAHPVVSDLDKNPVLHHQTLENSTSKKATVQSNSTKEATSNGAGTTRVECVPGRDDAAVSQSNLSPLTNVGTGYGTGTRPVGGRSYSLYNREENGLPNDVRQNTHLSTGSSATRFLQDRGKSDEKFQEFKSKRGDYSERSGKDNVHGAEALSVKKDRQSSYSAGTTSNLSSGGTAVRCSHCMLKGELICKNCLSIICKSCEKICETDLCKVTKSEHVFKELKDEGVSKKTENSSDAVYEGQEWSCSRCTFLNQQEHKRCVMCGATCGVGDVEQSKPGSKVCGNCTFHNEEDAKVCKACCKTLDKPETVV